MSTSPYTLISQDASHILRLVQQPYATTLQHYSDRGCDQIALDTDELAAVLRALPRATVLAALGLHEKCPGCAVCLFCAHCQCPETDDYAVLTLDLDPAVSPAAPIPYVLVDATATVAASGAWARPTPGAVCACDQHAGVPGADAACSKAQEDVAL